ncbi:hypothetical protein [Pseudarthrobacter sp. 1C304]|uniref:hypothetical protein n=1 Tax=Pseudarthrobacter sp. 1C304 TaxID=3457438 RepID=UPI003FCFF27B
MKPIEEQVQLPDPEQHFYVHPLDLPGARKEYLTGWWLGIAATPQVFTALLAALWAISNNRVTPIVVPLLLTVMAGFVSARLTRAAWDYIPRRRHDTQRRPARLGATAAVVKALSLLAGLVIFILWAGAQGFTGSFSSYPLGMGAALVLILALDLVVGLSRGRTRDADVLGGLLTLIVSAGALWGGFALLSDAADGLQWTGLVAGAATLVTVWSGWLAFAAWQTRRNHA